METCPGYRRCLICRRVTLENSSVDSEIVSNALLQDFLYCFNINVLDSKVHDLSTSCQFCQTCEQFIAEWSSIQTQMTQLTGRAAQLKATLTALLLSAHETQEQNHIEDDTEIFNQSVQNSQEVEPSLPLQHTVDDIRNELQRKYSVRVMLDKIQLPPVLKLEPLPVDSENVGEVWDHWECGANNQLPVVQKVEPLLSVGNNNDDELWDHWEDGDDDCDKEYLPDEDPLKDEETPEQILGMRIQTEEEANCDDSNMQDSVVSKEMEVEAGSVTNQYIRNREKLPVLIRDGPNKFKYNGFDVRLNDEDKCYYCGVCNYRGQTTVFSILAHIRSCHDTTAKAPPKEFKCETCGKELLNQKTYQRHIKLHQTTPINCPTCNKRFSCKRSVKNHMQASPICSWDP